MAECKECGNEVDRLVSAKIEGKKKKVCEDCAERARQQDEVAEEAEGAVRGMMEYKGKR
jgi:ribosome-binding protein aMBF1 (putative translation factor)